MFITHLFSIYVEQSKLKEDDDNVSFNSRYLDSGGGVLQIFHNQHSELIQR